MKIALDKRQAGFTLLEVLVALVILIITITGLTRLIITGDVIFSKGKAAASAAILAGNETEKIRAIAADGLDIKDTVYEESIQNSLYIVTRKVLVSDHFPDNGLNTREIVILIAEKPAGTVVKEFRVVQGISR